MSAVERWSGDDHRLLRRVEIAGRITDVRIRGGRIAETGTDLTGDGAEVVDGRSGALLPGLHDHHLHLLSTAAARESIDCSTTAGLRSLAAGPGTGWIRGIGYHESVAGPLDRHRLDQLVPDRPVRVQHRSGALWILNSLALRAVEPALNAGEDVERGPDGRPSGRLWRFDSRLRAALDEHLPDLTGLADELTAYGITSVTDATPELAAPAARALAGQIAPTVDVTVLGATGVLPAGLRHGPAKLHLRDHDLPSLEQLTTWIHDRHAVSRPVAVHCVTRESLLLTLAALRDAGPRPGDRIEHGAVVPPETRADLAGLRVAVVTQPGFLRLRGDTYLAEVDPDDLDCLYPYRSLLQAGIPVAASSDSPYGDLDPWQTIADATSRRSASGQILGETERVDTAIALAGYLSPPDDPGGRPRRLVPGAPARLCLLHVPLVEALRRPHRDHVRAVVTTPPGSQSIS